MPPASIAFITDRLCHQPDTTSSQDSADASPLTASTSIRSWPKVKRLMVGA
jgi:hypothetical protein